MKTKTKIKRKWGKVKSYYKVNRGALWFAFIAGIIAAIILINSLFNAPKTSPQPLGQTIEVKRVKVAEAKERPFCNNVINCIRDVGEELGRDNKTIMTMIRIAKCESGYRAEAINVNTNRTIDRGVFQVNSIHKALSNKDAFDYESNIRFAYQLQGKQGFTPWNASKKCWSI